MKILSLSSRRLPTLGFVAACLIAASGFFHAVLFAQDKPPVVNLTQVFVNERLSQNPVLILEKAHYEVAEVVTFPVTHSVEIGAGTVFSLTRDASLIFEGRLAAQGHADSPIVFEPAGSANDRWLNRLTEGIELGLLRILVQAYPVFDEKDSGRRVKQFLRKFAWRSQASWGGIALSGAGARGSRLEHVVIRRGLCPFYHETERFKGRSRPYAGALSLYQTEALVRHAYFDRNLTDALTVDQSQIVLEESVFVENKSDCVDLDSSEGKLLNNYFYGCGGDAVDLSHSRVRIESNVIVRSRGNGLEVGQRSQVEIRNNTVLSGKQAALEVSDESEVRLGPNVFLDNAQTQAMHLKEEGGYRSAGRILPER